MEHGWLLGVLVALGIGGGASAWLWAVGRKRDEAAAGVVALAGMRWREFSHFVLDAMRHRGYEVDTETEALERGQQSDFILRRGGSRWLLSCKHGSAYKIGAPAVAELVSAIRFNDASGGLLVTTGQVQGDARAAAEAAGVEVVGGNALWHEVRGLLPDSLRESLREAAEHDAKRRMGIAWLAAVVVGAAIAMLLPGPSAGTGDSERSPPAAAVTSPPAPRTAPAANDPRAGSPARPAGADDTGTTPAGPDPLREEAERAEVAQRVSALLGVERAYWSTRSTLVVHLASASADRLAEICTVVEQYESLRASRLQLQPPEGSPDPVRFRQCSVY